MFLWVRLVMSLLEDICYENDLREAIETLPRELEPLYINEVLFILARH